MTYRSFRIDQGERITDLAQEIPGPVFCHAADLADLLAAGFAASVLPYAGPQPGELWLEVG